MLCWYVVRISGLTNEFSDSHYVILILENVSSRHQGWLEVQAREEDRQRRFRRDLHRYRTVLTPAVGTNIEDDREVAIKLVSVCVRTFVGAHKIASSAAGPRGKGDVAPRGRERQAHCEKDA